MIQFRKVVMVILLAAIAFSSFAGSYDVMITPTKERDTDTVMSLLQRGMEVSYAQKMP